MVPILSTQGGIIMQNRQIRRVYLSLLAAAAVLCMAIYEDIYTHLLPESDVLALQQGVQVADEVELQRRLEDYGL